MDINQVYRAPSIPKLSKKNISSSVLRGASAVSSSTSLKPKLRSSIFSFRKPKTDVAENITAEQQQPQKPASVLDALDETNRILVEIQNQLALDFAMRIAEEKETTKKIRATESKKRFLDKESALEKAKNVGSVFKSQVDKVLAPTKSIFQKIIEFFKVILTGIVLNQAFKWLENKENREKLGKFFGFLAEHWKWIAATLGTVVLVDIISKVVLAVKGIMAAFALLTTPIGLGILAGIGIAIAAKKLREIQDAKRKEEQDAYVKAITGTNYETSVSGKPTQIVPYDPQRYKGASIFDLVKRGLSSSAGFSKGGEVFSNTLNFSSGGAVPGRGSGTVDTVPAMLAPGEYVVKTFATRLFRPFLSDINENAGRLFDQFRQAIIGLSNLVFVQSENAKIFKQLLKEFNDVLEQELKKKRLGQGGQGGGLDTRTYTPLKERGDVNTPVMSNVNMSFETTSSKNLLSGSAGVMKKPKVLREKTYSAISQSSRPSPKTNFVSMSLPPQRSKLPEIPVPTPKATDVPLISSVNMSDPYRRITPSMYGIHV